jgi:hypothetical protein
LLEHSIWPFQICAGSLVVFCLYLCLSRVADVRALIRQLASASTGVSIATMLAEACWRGCVGSLTLYHQQSLLADLSSITTVHCCNGVWCSAVVYPPGLSARYGAGAAWHVRPGYKHRQYCYCQVESVNTTSSGLLCTHMQLPAVLGDTTCSSSRVTNCGRSAKTRSG